VAGRDVQLFRPPYGKITRQQATGIRPTHQIIMWDVLSGDFDQNLSPADCLKKSIMHTEQGSIIIFHDSLKAWKNLEYVLPRYLEHFHSCGYKFEKL
jgi:peptidoglycan/xylan/chitin deacetylase (PgdA/CDA1 family)